METRKKIGLALGSGGARGFCHIGILKVLVENNVPIDFISGCSIGSLAAAGFSLGVSIDAMIEATRSIKQRTIMDIGFSRNGYNNSSGFIRGNRVMQLATKLIGQKNFEDTKIPLRITACNLTTGKLVVFDSGPILPAIRASISMPAIFKAPYDEQHNILVDGGLIERIPIDAVKELGSDVVIAVDALGPARDSFKVKGFRTYTDIIERSYLLLDWESAKHKIKKADLLITPEQGDRSLYVFKNNEQSIQAGIEAADNKLEEILQLIK